MDNWLNFNSILGKLILIILIIIAAHFHVLAGILLLLVVISMKQTLIEGMENNDNKGDDVAHNNNEVSSKVSNDNKDDSSSVSIFKKNNCKNGVLMKDGNKVTNGLIKTSFPNLKFTKDVCNPCDDDCEFEIVSSAEQLTNEENLRPQDSNAHAIDREKATKKQ